MSATNSRRPGGYRGSPERRLVMLIEDAIAAVECARDLHRRALAGELVMQEVLREETDALFRAFELRHVAGLGLPGFYTLIELEQDAARQRVRAMCPHMDFSSERSRPEAPPRRPDPAEAAARFLVEHAGTPKVSVVKVLEDPGTALRAYRRAAKRLHPDKGGDTRLMQKLVDAKEQLDRRRN